MADLSWNAVKKRVHERASNRCEYCQTSMDTTGQAMHIDHIDPSGGNSLDNLCLACANCNLSKSNVIQASDPASGERLLLFNPRSQRWQDHFEWIDNGLRLHGLTSTGRATVERLNMNRSRMVRARRRWIEAGLHPPTD